MAGLVWRKGFACEVCLFCVVCGLCCVVFALLFRVDSTALSQLIRKKDCEELQCCMLNLKICIAIDF
jgi:hypothetical protein